MVHLPRALTVCGDAELAELPLALAQVRRGLSLGVPDLHGWCGLAHVILHTRPLHISQACVGEIPNSAANFL